MFFLKKECVVSRIQRGHQSLCFLLCGGGCKMQQLVFYFGGDIVACP